MENEKMPLGWIETTLGEVANFYYGKGLSTNVLEQVGFPVYGANGVIGYFAEYMFEESKLIISCRGAASGVTHITQPKSLVTSNSIIIDVPKNLVSISFLNFFLLYSDKTKIITGTAQPQITINNLKDFKIMLAPFAEQTRIVAEIETVLAWVEKAQAELDKIPALLKAFRQKVLAMAVSGELTADFRGKDTPSVSNNEKSKIPKNWQLLALKQVNEVVTDGDHLPPPQTSNGIPFIVISNLKNDEIIFNDKRFVPEKYFEQLKDYRKPRVNDILFSVTGSIGLTALIEEDIKFCFQRHIGLLRPNEKVLPKFLKLSMQAPSIQQKAVALARGVAQLTLSLGALREIEIPVPPISEQTEIVRRVEELFSWTGELEAHYTEGSSKLKQMPQTLLQKAFTGALVPQDPTDASASVLLEQIRLEKERLLALGKGRKKRQ